MSQPRAKPSRTIKVRLYPIVAEKIAEATLFGVSRAYKYTDEPGRDAIAECVENEVMNALCELFDFGDP